MTEIRTTAEILRDAKIRAASDPVLARVAARQHAQRQFDQEILDRRETQSDRDAWFDQN